MPTPKLLVLDLDGTALTRAGQVSEPDARAARALAAHGVALTIATGRLFRGTREAASRLGVRGSLAVMNGAEIVDADSGAVRHGRYVHPRHRNPLRRLLDRLGIAPILFGAEHIAHDGRGAHLSAYLRTWTPEVHPHEDLPDQAWHQDRLLAVAGAGEAGAIQAAVDQVQADFPDLQPASFTTWDGHAFLELRAQGEDKGTALARLAADRGLEPHQAIAVGDWRNDVSMLRAAGRSFAMSGADATATRAADATLQARRGEGGAVVEIARRVFGLEV